MGQFSWLCAYCEGQILSEGDAWDCFKCEQEFPGKETVVVATPDGDNLVEEDYEGYGVFGGIDIYSWLARVNGYSDLHIDSEDDSDRSIGIEIHFDKSIKLKYEIKIVHERCHRNIPYNSLSSSRDDPDQGWQSDMVEEGNLTLCEDCANW
tara:strand:+ start:2545 stop:2997 length:453 start_codon:yes stop_codon:yes gene_type:complete